MVVHYRWTLGPVIAMEMKTSKGTDKWEGVSKLPRRFLYYQVAGALH